MTERQTKVQYMVDNKQNSTEALGSYSLPQLSNEPSLLPVFYYLDNFRSVLKTVYTLYDDLLSNEEVLFYKHFGRLPRDAQALLVRMLSRKGEYFRESKVEYQEISDTKLALNDLEIAGFIEHSDFASVDDVFKLYTKAEWLKYLGLSNKSSIKKADIYSTLLETCSATENGNVKLDWNDRVIKLKASSIFETYKLLYFGNGRQDLTEFVLRDLGVQRFENYQLDRANRLFNDRHTINQMLIYYEALVQLDDIKTMSKDELLCLNKYLPSLPEILPVSSGGERALKRRLERLRISIARQLERISAWVDALDIYQQCELPPSGERGVRVLYKLERYQEAYMHCKRLINSDSDAESEFANQFIVKIAKKLNEKLSTKNSARYTEECIGLAFQEGKSVESIVAEHYSQQGECFYVENHLFLSVFGMVFWDAVFAPVSGAFTHPFQYAPHDLNEPEFLEIREQTALRCWQKMPALLSSPVSIEEFFRTKAGIANPFLFWKIPELDVVLKAISRIPLSDFESVFKRLWQNVKENRNGFPDLILFPDSGGYELIEVKGPGDRLQKNQKRWLDHFERAGIPYRVCYVQWRR